MANGCILVVERDALIRLEISDHLREAGVVVVEAASAAAGLWTFIAKPYAPERVTTAIAEALGLRQKDEP
jgi:DNA-binding NtrC family response regulator